MTILEAIICIYRLADIYDFSFKEDTETQELTRPDGSTIKVRGERDGEDQTFTVSIMHETHSYSLGTVGTIEELSRLVKEAVSMTTDKRDQTS